jgi:membrane protease YdiL (CAAX protease family)
MTTRWPTPREAVREHTIELLVFLFLILPSLVLSLFATEVVTEAATAGSFPLVAVATILRDLALVALVLFFLWRNAEPLTQIGWTARRAPLEVLLGVGLYVPATFAAALLDLALTHAGLSAPSHPPHELTPTHGETPLAVVLVLVVAFAEETIFRGYILSRLREVTRNTTLSVLLSAGLFAVGHGYEGSAGVVSVGFLGVVFALVYVWRKSLVAPITMHFCQDFVAVILVPALTGAPALTHGHGA